MNWLINTETATKLNYKVIRFDIIVSENQLINPLLTAIKYNLKKADWKEFNQYLKLNFSETKQQMQQLLNNHKFN